MKLLLQENDEYDKHYWREMLYLLRKLKLCYKSILHTKQVLSL